MSKEIVCINVGQAGVQMSNSCWELFCIEHGLDCCGVVKKTNEITAKGDDPIRSNLDTFFHESSSGNYVPRAVSVDLEASVLVLCLDEIRTGPYRNLWNPECLISGIEDAANNFGRGYISVGRTMIQTFMGRLAKVVESCEKLHGIIFLHSYSGGTGSGFTNLILDHVRSEYTKVTNIASVVFPSPNQSTAVVEPYNCLLSAVTSIYNIDVALLSDNECLYDLCSRKLMIERPTYQNINRLLSQLFSSLTVTLRFRSSLDHDFVHLQTNLIPFPRIHFPIATFAPLSDEAKTDHESISIQEITHDLFDEESRFVSCDMTEGKYMACCLHYRGLVMPGEVNKALLEIKRRKEIIFVDWSPVGFKVGISPMPPASVAHSDLAATNKNCSMFFNSTAIESIWNVIHRKFKALFKKRAFFHWFIGEGMEESEFHTCTEDICQLQKDYKEIGDQSDAWFQEKYSNDEREDMDDIKYNDNSFVSETVKSVDGNTNNNLPNENENNSTLHSHCSNHSNQSLLQCIKRVTFIPDHRNSFKDAYDKNRSLLKLFEQCAQ